MDNNQITHSKKHKIIIGLLLFLIVIFGSVVAFLVVNSNKQREQIKKLEDSINKQQKKSEESNKSIDNKKESPKPIKKFTYKSEITNLKFDYPENWKMQEEMKYDFSNAYHDIVLTNENGQKIIYKEDEGGLGFGPCEPGKNKDQFKRHALVVNNNLSVVEVRGNYTGDINEEYHNIYISTDTSLKDGPVDICDLHTKGVISGGLDSTRGGIYKNNNRRPAITFSYHSYKQPNKLSEKEKLEVISILSSLSLQ